MCKPVLGPTQPPVQLVIDGSFTGTKAKTTHFNFVPALRISEAVPTLHYMLLWQAERKKLLFVLNKILLNLFAAVKVRWNV
jgi:hypothetical protein